MIVKAIVLSRVKRENKKFEKAYLNLASKELGSLNAKGEESDEDFDESPLLLSFTQKHDVFAGSTL